MDRGAWWATVHGVAKQDTTEQLSTAQQVIMYMTCICDYDNSKNADGLPIFYSHFYLGDSLVIS